ncbi:MAG: ATP-binding protein [Bacteroidota bacterium]
MKSHAFFIVFLLTTAVACAQLVKPGTVLKKQWETEPGLKVPESVLYDTASGLIFVSNINGKPAEKDTNGFIATLSMDGKILNADWVKGLDAPKGMGILNKHLFVTNIDEIVEIDIRTASILNRYPVDGAKFLNDIAVDPVSGMVFVSETANGQVYVLFDGKTNLWLEGDMFKGANGLFLRDSILYIGTGNSVLQADIRSGEVLVSMTNIGDVDGLYVTPDNKFIFSDWTGTVFIATKRKKPEILLEPFPGVNAADFGIILSKNSLLVPTFGNNKVVCYTSPLIK